MIKFIRLLFYHIYIYYDKTEGSGKIVTKLSTALVFTVVFILLIDSVFNLGYQIIDKDFTGVSGKAYIFMCITIGIIVGLYIYKEDFQNLNTFKNYHTKYYLYFFLIVLFLLALEIYSIQINRERIFKQREMHKEQVENMENNMRVN
ncbi:hypothetical protein [Epilithonimonas caeni]|uniref:hypothetical protein n=1 Tax=Epilithonimonas caeni TaxID=365343 RepID=UPI00048681F3|nr:hypothetical protein [Epilithonimonas caeni]